MIEYKLSVSEQWFKLSELSTQYCRNRMLYNKTLSDDITYFLNQNFKATLWYDSSMSPIIKFNNERDLTMFLLKL